MARIASFADAGVRFDPAAPLAATAQLVARLRLAIDAERIPPGSMLPSIRLGARELGVHSNTLRKVYASLEQSGHASTRHGSGTTAQPTGECEGVLALADETAERARAAGIDPSALASALLAGIDAVPASATPPRQPAARAGRTPPPALPGELLARGRTIGLVTSDDALVARAKRQCADAGTRLLVAERGDAFALGNLAWACPLILLAPDAAGDPQTVRALRGARAVEPL